MTGMPGSATGWSGPFGGLLLLAAFGYAGGMLAARRRGRCWPAGRAACWYAGLVAAVAGVVGPAAGPGFAAHTAGHLLLGMAAPLLLVLAAPGTLALRALPVRPARRLCRVLATRTVRVLTHPVTAAVLDGGGLWLLYATDLYPVMMHRPAVHLLVQVHVLAAGFLLTMAVVGIDPAPHRSRRSVRAATLLIFLAVHAVLAKHLYAHPPAGVPGPDARAGALLMYYGGDAVHIALITVFCWQWYDPARFRVSCRRAPLPWRLSAAEPPPTQHQHQHQRDRQEQTYRRWHAVPQQGQQPATEDDRSAHGRNLHARRLPGRLSPTGRPWPR
jgi:putative membrane protein